MVTHLLTWYDGYQHDRSMKGKIMATRNRRPAPKPAPKIDTTTEETTMPETTDTNATESAPTGTGLSAVLGNLDSLIQPAELPATAAPENPFEKHVLATVDMPGLEGLAFPVPSEVVAKQVTGMIRTAANKHKLGMTVRTVQENGGYVVKFKASREKRERQNRWSNQDIKDWAKDNDVELPDGKITTEVRDAFKKANGFE